MDVLTREQRRYCMSRIRGKNTKPEIAIRQALHALGLRYRLHYERLPGTPDLVFPGKRAVLFVNGCFWHCHDCALRVTPRTNEEFWLEKARYTRARDAKVLADLKSLGWRAFVVWECSMRGPNRANLGALARRIKTWIESDKDHGQVSSTSVQSKTTYPR